MARAKSPEKRSAILDAAVAEIVASGLQAATARIARRAGVAEGTLFTYFPTKDALLNELYLELKTEVYAAVNADPPRDGGLEQRAWHLWSSYLGWSLQYPGRCRASVLLNLSDAIAPETRASAAERRGVVATVLGELAERDSLRGLPPETATAMMSAMQEAARELITRHPQRREELVAETFRLFWQAVQ